MVAKLARWAKEAGEKTFHLQRLNIGPRLTLCFVFIILAMLVGDAALLWQFHLVRAQAERLSGVDQELIAALQVHTNLMTLYERLDSLAHSENTAPLVKEVEALQNALLEDSQRSRNALTGLPPEVPLDPTVLPTLEAIEDALPEQLEAITALAKSRDWEAVRLRLANEVGPLESRTSALVQNVDREVEEERAQSTKNIKRVERRVFFLVPMTAVFTLLIAGTLGLAITHSITQPLARLVEGSEALAQGEFQHRVAISGGDELAHLGQVFNDTARRLRDLYATLQASERELRQLIEVIPQHVVVSEPDGTLSYVNQVALEYTGLTLEDALSKEAAAKIFHPDDLERALGARQSAISSSGEWEVEARVRRKDGEYRWFLIRFNPLRDEQERIFRWYGTRTDIEDRKQAEDALRQAQAELAHITRVATIGEMTASIAHEVNQPIAAVVTNAGAGLRWLAAQPPDLEEARQAFARIVKDGKRAGEVIARIRALIKKSPLQRDWLDINETILEVVFLTGSEVRKNRISLQAQLSSDLPHILGDRIQLQQVILNLVKNAIEAMSEVNEGERELVLSSGKDGSKGVLVAVRDSGPGLEPKALAHLFDTFYTTKPEGMGMGLAISRSIIEAHGGRLWAAPNQARGALFQFTLPADSDRML